MHTALTLWIFSHPLYFPTRYYTYTVKNVTYYYVKSLIFYDRIFTSNGFQYFVLLCAQIVIVFLIYPISEVCIKKWLKARNQRRIQVFTTLAEDKMWMDKNNYINKMDYDMMQKKRFKRALALMNAKSSKANESNVHEGELEMQNLTLLKSETTFNHINPGGSAQGLSAEGRDTPNELGIGFARSQQKNLESQKKVSRLSKI